MRVALAGDVMAGRGVDQALATSVDPELNEPFVKDARHYLEIAGGSRRVSLSPEDIWSEALPALARARPDHFVVNLETSITDGGDFDVQKGIHYRMHPENVAVLTAAGVDCCTLANNHVLDFGPQGLEDTLDALDRAGIRHCGAGRSDTEARQPVDLSPGPVRVLATALADSGVPPSWSSARSAGVFFQPAADDAAVEAVRAALRRDAGGAAPGPLICSIHWGGNWSPVVPDVHRHFARRLIRDVGVDLVFGHSSHHLMPIEVFDGVPIVYGAGDLLNDYEGIGGHEPYEPGLVAIYLVHFDSGRPRELEVLPFRLTNLALRAATRREVEGIRERLVAGSFELDIVQGTDGPTLRGTIG